MNKWWIVFIFIICISSLFSKYQEEMNYVGDMDSWGLTSMTYDSDLNVWSVSIQSDGDDDNSYYKFINGYGWNENNVWSTQTSTDFTTVQTATHRGTSELTAGDFDETNTNYYIFSIYDVNYGSDSQSMVQQLSSSPNTISSITEPATVYQDETQTITITLSGSKVTEEKVYLCYTTDNWSSRTNALATGSGTSWGATIPKQNIGTTVKFYAMTTTTSSGSWGTDEALHTLDHEYSQSNPFSYTVTDHNNTTYHTIEIEGQKDFSNASERTNGSGVDNYWWYTWDENNLYFAIQQGAIDENDANKWVVLYIDSDPQLTETNGSGTSTGCLINSQQPALPFTANFHFRWNTDGSTFELYEYTDNWASISHSLTSYREDEFYEVKIPLSDIDNPEAVYVCGNMLNSTDYAETMWTFTPSDASSDDTDGYNKGLDSYWGFDLTSGETPNSSGNEDNPLPVSLSSFSGVFNGEVPILQWSTASEINNAGWNVYRATTENFGNSLQVNPTLIDGQGTSSQITNYEFIDLADYSYGHMYYYWLESIDFSNSHESYGPISLFIPIPEDDNNNSPTIPETKGLRQNYPNPFNPSTEISFQLEYSTKASLIIYNIQGKTVKTIIDNYSVTKDQTYNFVWDGNDQNGRSCSSGIYFYELITGQEILRRRMLLIK